MVHQKQIQTNYHDACGQRVPTRLPPRSNANNGHLQIVTDTLWEPTIYLFVQYNCEFIWFHQFNEDKHGSGVAIVVRIYTYAGSKLITLEYGLARHHSFKWNSNTATCFSTSRAMYHKQATNTINSITKQYKRTACIIFIRANGISFKLVA